MRDVPLTVALPLALATAATPVLGSDLKIDGETAITKTLGGTIQMDLKATGPLLPAAIAVDVAPGPISLFGESLPIGFSPLMQVAATGVTNNVGLFGGSLPIPVLPGLDGVTLYFLGVVIDPDDQNGLDFSNGAKALLQAGAPGDFTEAELAGNTRAAYPHFEWVTSFNEGAEVKVAVDPSAHPDVVGQTAHVYVTASKSADEWNTDPSLTDVSGDGADTVVFSAAGLQNNIFTIDTGTLSGTVFAPTLGTPYDVVVDLDQNGLLGDGDLIDGYGPKAGMYVVHDFVSSGPYAVTEVVYSGGSWKDQDLYYPTNVADLGQLPLVIISHGNGHNYQWYDYIGYHLASYGYIVMSHSNNTGPGIQTASTTTLDNTDSFLGNLATLPQGANVIDGHVDSSRIIWLGHSRGGEGACRAYDRIVDGTYTPNNFTADDIILISSIAPTDFLGTTSSTPHDKSFHLWVGAADSDVSGCVSSNVTQSYHLLGRAEDQRQGITLYGVGHGWFHDNGGNPWASGPCQLNENLTHQIVVGYLLPLVEWHAQANPAALDFLWRQWEDFHPIGAPASNPCAVVNLQYLEAEEAGGFTIDDFQTFPASSRSSSGGGVLWTTELWTEGRLDDPDSDFTHGASEMFNGFSYCNASDPERGGVLSYQNQDSILTYAIVAAGQDWSELGYLTFRACQTTRHPYTTGENADVSFEVRLKDGDGDTSTMGIDYSGHGIEEPYQRTSCGTGTGWGNEFETIRIHLQGFTVDNPAFDLDAVVSLEFLFGPSHGSSTARLGIDDVAVEAN